MPRCGTTFDENIVLPWTRGDFRGVFEHGNRPTPLRRDRVASRHPSRGGDFQEEERIEVGFITRACQCRFSPPCEAHKGEIKRGSGLAPKSETNG